MIFEAGAIALGILISFFLKDINFLGINLSFLNSGLIYPDFLLVFLIYFSLNKGEFSGIWIGFFAGLMEDSGLLQFADIQREFLPIIGVHSLVYTITGFSLGKLTRFIDRDHAIPQMVLVLITTVIVRFFIWLIMGVLQDFNSSYSFFGPAVYTALFTPIWFTLLSWIYRLPGDDVK